MTARLLTIHGKVQGVFFRSSARDMAVILGLQGRVRNRMDGSVRVWIEGPEEAVESMTEWCRKGPARAEVERVDREDVAPHGYTDFRVERESDF